MKNTFLIKAQTEPYRFFFPVGIFFLLWGSLLWLPQLWNNETYPVMTHRYLMLNGFSASFIAGFLMTSLPQFAKAPPPRYVEIALFFAITLLGLSGALRENEKLVFSASGLQSALLLYFVFKRIINKKENPPYSFIFIPAGLGLWLVSALMSLFVNNEIFKNLHYEGAQAAIILGVGTRLLPGILGHSEIVSSQRARYEIERPYLYTAPLPFLFLIVLFVGSYFFKGDEGVAFRASGVLLIALLYWKIISLPKKRTALTWNIWLACWLIVLSFLLKAMWTKGIIHASHAFFFSGSVLLAFLVATRVTQSHGPKEPRLEDSKVLYFFAALVVLAGITRVTAFLMPVQYLHHLAYSSITLCAAVGLWAVKYLRYMNTKTS